MRDFALEVHFSRWEFKARHHMTASDAESMSVGALLEMAGADAEVLTQTWLGYTETWGAPDLRAAIAETYDGLEPADILTFAGAEEGIYAAMRVILEPGDHAIVAVPNYQAAETLPLSICDVTGVPLEADRDWALDPERIAAVIRPETKLVSINFPTIRPARSEAGLDAEAGKRQLQEIDAAAIKGFRGDDVMSSAHQGGDCQMQGRLTACGRDRADTAFERGEALFKHGDGRVRYPGINVPCPLQIEKRGRLIRVLKDIRRRLIDRRCPGPRDRVWLLAAMQRHGIEFQEFRIDHR